MRTLRFVMLGICVLFFSGCSNQPISTPVQPTPFLTVTPTSVTTPTAAATSSGGISLPIISDLATAIPSMPTRTPMPTATPDAVTKAISQFLQNRGVSGYTVFWIRYADWINLGISLLYVLVGYLIGTWLIRWLLPRIVKRTKTNLDDLLLQVSGNELRWLAVVLILRFSANRLTFISAGIKIFFTDVCFLISLFLVAVILWRLIDLAAKQAELTAIKTGQKKEAESLITLAIWALRFIELLLVITLLLNHYTINVTGFTLFIAIIALVLSFASRDVFADVISGAMILVDRPFRVGDRLELQSINSWGDVVEIGMRSTKILSVENRMVVVPNSQIGKNQIVNYSFADPAYLDIVNVLVGYDNDVDRVKQLLTEAILSVEGVQKDREIYTLLIEFNETHMVFWAGWWIKNYKDRYPVHDRVSRAIISKLNNAGVELPSRRGRLEVETKSQNPE